MLLGISAKKYKMPRFALDITGVMVYIKSNIINTWKEVICKHIV